jgi:hypothetical protein
MVQLDGKSSKMSHKTITVAGKAPDAQGEITITPEDLSDVTVTGLVSGEVLTYEYASSTWKNVAPSGTNITFCFIGDGEKDGTVAYDISLKSAPFQLELYATTPVVSSSWTPTFTTITKSGGSSTPNWIQSFTLPAGTYHLRASLPCTFSSSASHKFMRICWYENTSQISSGTMYSAWEGNAPCGFATAIITSTGTESYSVFCVYKSGALILESDHSFIEIMKLS